MVHTGSALEFLDDAELTQRLLGVSAEAAHGPGDTGRPQEPAAEPAGKGAAL